MREKWRRRLLPKTPWGDRIFARHRFYRRLGRSPENSPVRFNDHLFALKAGGMGYDPLIQYVTDKEYAKQYVSSVVGSNYTTETYRILRNKEELKTYVPDRFPCILKPTHSSGQAVICADQSGSLDREKLGRWLYINYYYLSREQNYRHLVPKIIVEEFFSKDGQTVPDDYKIFCFRGVPKLIQVDSGSFFPAYSEPLRYIVESASRDLRLPEQDEGRSEARTTRRNASCGARTFSAISFRTSGHVFYRIRNAGGRADNLSRKRLRIAETRRSGIHSRRTFPLSGGGIAANRNSCVRLNK